MDTLSDTQSLAVSDMLPTARAEEDSATQMEVPGALSSWEIENIGLMKQKCI